MNFYKIILKDNLTHTLNGMYGFFDIKSVIDFPKHY